MKRKPKVKPKMAEWWYFKLPGSVALSRSQITDLTPLTVEFEGEYSTTRIRYALSDIKFVERVKFKPKDFESDAGSESPPQGQDPH